MPLLTDFAVADRGLVAFDRDLTPAQRRDCLATDFARFVACLYETQGAPMMAAGVALERWPSMLGKPYFEKAAIDPGMTTAGNWASPLSAVRGIADAFVSLSRQASILGQIPQLRTVPFNVSIAVQVSGAAYAWVGQGLPKPASPISFSSVTIPPSKAIGLIAVSAELLKLTSPASAATLRDELVAGLAAFLDVQFLDPAVAPVADVSPGSITNGVTAIPSTGDPVKDLRALASAMSGAASLALVLSPANALTMSASGALRDVRTTILTTPAAADNIIAVDGSRILVADDGGITLDVSRHATVQMDTAPANPPTPLTNLWQQNLVGLKVERFIGWKRAALTAVAYVSGATYDGA
jgi:hypothetical protein